MCRLRIREKFVKRRKIFVSGDINRFDGFGLELLLAPAGVNFGESQHPQVNIEGILIVIGERVQSLLACREETEIFFYLLAVLLLREGFF